MKKAFLAACIVGVLSQPGFGENSGAKLINGKPVTKGTFKEVIMTHWDGYSCSATIVGPRVVILAAHCSKPHDYISFNYNHKVYAAQFFMSSLYKPDDLEKDHDVAVGIVDEVIENVKPATIGGKAWVGSDITLLGYGCLDGSGAGGNDGILRIGNSRITELSQYVMISKRDDGAVLCFGDSGGPTFLMENGKRLFLGNHAASNLRDTNFDTRADAKATHEFLADIAAQENVDICGINVTCPSLEAYE